MNNGSKINWLDILIKLILVVLFVLLLIWLIPKNNVDGVNDAVFRNNVDTMKNAAKSYYTKDRLPSNVGESTRMTLKQMLDKKMIVEFTDKNGKTCNTESSYVEVTKTSDNEYVLKVQLNCDKQQDYILETIGCNDVCPNGKCEVSVIDKKEETKTTEETPNIDIKTGQITYYQHRKPIYTTNTVYSCPEGQGYTLNGSTCTKSTIGATILATPIYADSLTITTPAKVVSGTEYKSYIDPIVTEIGSEVCPTGYTKNGSYCIKYADATPKIVSYSTTCPAGYDLNAAKTECYKYVDATYTRDPGYTCPNGGYVSGDKCVVNTTSITDWVCPAGYDRNGTSCYKIYQASPSGSSSYTCPNGGDLRGDRCYYTAAVSSTSYCPNGGSLNGNKCVYKASTTSSKSCPNGGTLSGDNCVYKASSSTKTCPLGGTLSGDNCVYKASSSTKYTCPKGGDLNGTKCVTSTSKAASKKVSSYGEWTYAGSSYSSSAGGAYTGDTTKVTFDGVVSGTVCGAPCGNKGTWYKYSTYTRKVNYTYYCPNGGDLSGTSCITKSQYDATPTIKKTCPNGGGLSGDNCVYTAASSKKTCPNGGTLSGENCVYTATSSSKKTCPNGGSVNGDNCVYEASEHIDYVCKYGTNPSLSGTTCSYSARQESASHYCPQGGTLNTVNNTCTITISATPASNTCPSGTYNDNGRCVYDAVYEINGKWTCPNGGEVSGNRCLLTRQPITEPVYQNVCPDGYTPNGNKCELVIPATIAKEKTYTCPVDYTQEGTGANTRCYKIVKTEGKYYCEDASAKLEGKVCVKTIQGGIKGYTCPSNDYKLEGDKCTKYSTVSIKANESTKTSVSYQYKWSTESHIDGWEFTGNTKTEPYTAYQK